MANISGVYLCSDNMFQIGKAKDSLNNIAETESFSVSFDNGIEEWTSFNAEGWASRLMTAKSLTISVTGKRSVGDPGNDFIADMAFKNGRDAEAVLQWTFPDRTKVLFNVVINVGALGSGDSTAVAPLEFEALSNGKPEVIPAI